MMNQRNSNVLGFFKGLIQPYSFCNGMEEWIFMGNLQMLKTYFGQDLGNFYAHATNRLILYPFFFTFFLIECATFWLLYLGPGFVADYMAFVTVYTLHKAAVYAICIVMADMLTHHMLPSWGAYGKRKVGQQWLIWSSGLAIGLILQRTMIKAIVPVYAPDVIAYFVANPQARLSTITLLLILIPYWFVVVFLTLRIALSKQRIQQLADSLMVIPENHPFERMPGTPKTKRIPVGILKLDGDNNAIALADITHVTVEDHYCRVNYTTGNGLKSEMIRLPLKEMLRKLPQDHFLRIHRSHVVNTDYISRVSKSGRNHKVILEKYNVELPVSRSRFKDLHPRLKVAVINH